MVPMVVAAMPENCTIPAPVGASAANVASLGTLAWSPFGRPETGWTVYYPRVAVELGTTCPVASEGFAAKLADWQARHRLAPTGVFDPLTFVAMKSRWQSARPFAHIDGKNACPPPPPDTALAAAAPREVFAGKSIRLRTAALTAYRAMVAAARRDPAVAAEPRALTIFSAFRDPDSDAARCTAEGNCNGIVRATCSAHRTGLALDMWVGQAPGYGPDSTADANRAAMVASPAYRWLLVHAKQYGFVNYVFEPWHWEWTGEPI
nr:M15 family metallopeptidase [Polymorphobacter sp.]